MSARGGTRDADGVEPMAYIARKACGCIVMATSDDPNHARDVAKEVASCIRDGLTIEHVTAQYVRDNWRACTHDKTAKSAGQQELF